VPSRIHRQDHGRGRNEPFRVGHPPFDSFYVSDEAFRLPGYLAIGVVLVLGFLFVRYGIPAWRHYRDPGTHPLLARIGPWGDPLGVAVEVERDFGTPRYKASGWRIGDKYLVQSPFLMFNVLRLRDLLWAYKKVTKHSVNFIPTGKTYEAILTCYGGAATIRRKQQQVDEILAYVRQRVPWALLGYSPTRRRSSRRSHRSSRVRSSGGGPSGSRRPGRSESRRAHRVDFADGSRHREGADDR